LSVPMVLPDDGGTSYLLICAQPLLRDAASHAAD